MYEGDGGGDWDEENDRPERDYSRDMDKGPSLLSFAWSEDARNNEDSDINIFEKTILVMLDIINGDFIISSDLTSGGDGRSEFDFGQDMSQENSSNDMMNDAYPDQDKPNQQQRAAWDTNGDGKITVSEANNWYRNGNGQAITVDASKIDLNAVNTNGWVKGNTYGVQTLLNSEQGRVLGNITVEYLGNNQVRILSDTYNFEQHGSYWSSPIRNPANTLGRWVAGEGKEFQINFKGVNTIKHSKGYDFTKDLK